MDKLIEEGNNFLDYCLKNRRLTLNTVRVYRFDLQHFNKFLSQEAQSITDFKEVSKATLENYLGSLQNYSVKTIKRKFACIRSLFHYLEYEEKIEQNPFVRFQLNVREPYKLRTTMNIEEIGKLLSVAYDEKPNGVSERMETLQLKCFKITSEEFIWIRDIALLELLFVGGLRVSELCSLVYNDINLKHYAIMIHGKGNKERMIYLENQEVILALNKYLYFRKNANINLPCVFITKFGHILSTQAVRNLVTKYSKLAGITKNITPHVFRHTFATLLLEEGVDIKYIQDFLGHSSISTTQIYLHTTNKQKRKIIATQHPRQKLYFSGNSPMDNVKLSSEGEDNLSKNPK
ncbi:MAG TPA: tyrosine-type recombinase/integrase [Anaerovoracaceae bacterium]|nr:tyrosine-type recombinase/integrase [Anaerovoracaceae bacterium]